MTKKNIFLIALALLLGGLSLYLNRDWFGSKTIQVSHRSLPDRSPRSRRGRADNAAVNPVIFLLNQKLKLTSVQVIPVADLETNKYPHPIWNLISDSNSIPTQEFVYGANIRGMKPAVKGDIPDPLQPGVKYRLAIEAGPLKAEHDFIPVPRTP